MIIKKFRVEFNDTGFYSGAGIWDTLDEFCDIEAEDASEAIDLAKTFWMENTSSCYYEIAKSAIENWAWRAAEVKYDECGYLEPYKWEFE